jgi:hypothetical protein
MREVGSLVITSGRRTVAVTPCSSLLRRPNGQLLRTPDLEGRHFKLVLVLLIANKHSESDSAGFDAMFGGSP